jgi:hypothetical protein
VFKLSHCHTTTLLIHIVASAANRGNCKIDKTRALSAIATHCSQI